MSASMEEDDAPRRSVRARKQRILDDFTSASPTLPLATCCIPLSTLPTQPPKLRKTASDLNKEYRARIKADPESYDLYRKENALRCKQYRQKADAATKETWKIQSTARSAKKRQRDRETKASQPAKPRTRKDDERERIKRAKDAQRKREQRASRTPQQKRRDNEKRRKQRSGMASLQLLLENADTSEKTATDVVETRTLQARRQALSRIRRHMPQKPVMYATTVSDLIHKASPNKQLALERVGCVAPENEEVQGVGILVIKAVQQLKDKKDSQSRAKRTLLLQSLENLCGQRKKSRILAMSRKAVAGKKLEKKRTKRTEMLQEDVASYFNENAVPLPDKKHVCKKTGKSRSVAQLPLQDLHKDYKVKGGQAAFSTFAKCRPAHVRTMMKSHLRQCLCEYCANVDQKLKVTNGLCIQHNCRIRHVYHAAQLSVCNGQKKDCAYRKCPDCDISLLQDYLAPLHVHGREVQWHRWTSKKIGVSGHEVMRKVLETRRGSTIQLIQELCQEVAFLSEHLFRASWQQKQFEALRTAQPFPPQTVAMVMDFAENYTCMYQDEVQAAHWHHSQVTVHPIVTYYKCQHCHSTMSESLVFISSDITHDHHAVHNFVTLAMNHLRNKRHLHLTRMIQWSDGCASQYKSKGPFADISFSREDFNMSAERHYFGSRHGKGPSDGESAVVKNHASTAVKAGRGVIADAEDFYEYCIRSSLNKQPQPEVCDHFLRSFFWVAEGDILRERPRRNMKTVRGTRDFHQVKAGPAAGTIVTRHLSCFCPACLTGDGACVNIEVVGEQQERSMIPNDETRYQPCASSAPPSPPVAQDLAERVYHCLLLEPDVPVQSVPAEQDAPLQSMLLEPDVAPQSVPLMTAMLSTIRLHDRSLVTGAWVKAQFHVGRRTEEYIGKIMDIDEARKEYQLKFLRSRGVLLQLAGHRRHILDNIQSNSLRNGQSKHNCPRSVHF